LNKYYPRTGKLKLWLLRFLVTAVLLVCSLFLFYSFNRGPKNQYSKTLNGVSIRQIQGRYNFYKNDKPFIVKGGAGFTHIKELVNAGGNTIICWDTAKLANTFKEAVKNNVAVIVGLDIPGGDNADFYNKDSNTNLLYNNYKQIVSRYKDEPALLAWCLGNELDMPLTFTTVPFYKTYNKLLGTIHQIDPDHPVSTATINVAKRYIFNIRWRIPALDFICINTYNRIKTIETDLSLIKWIWNGPYLIGEWSPNGGWEASLTTWQAPIENTSTKKAGQYAEFYTKYMPRNDPRFLGSMVFYWGNRQEYTHTWYSIFNEDDTPTETLEVLNDCWKDTVTRHHSPRLQYMLVDKLSGESNIIFAAGTAHQATVFLEKPAATDTLVYQWQIVKEDWQHWGLTWDNFKKPAVQTGLMTDSLHNEITFTAPAGEGPYRIFVTVKNPAGFCATANTPFYVVQ
jgi:hypothetical protein